MADGTQLPTSSLQNTLAQQALAYGGIGAVPAVQRSALLADMLQQMREHGGDNLRTPTALGSNLLADALERIQLGHANKALAAQVGGGMTDAATDAQRGIYAPPEDAGSPSGAGGAGGATDTQPPAGYMPPAAAAPPPPPAQASAGPGAAERDLLARLLVGEAGDSKADELAAASVIANRAKMGGQSLTDVISAPHQFEAYDNPKTWARLQQLSPNSPQYQQAMSAADQVMSQGPIGPYDHFYSPGAQSALGRAKPAWDDGSGKQIGGQLYFSQGYGGKPPGAFAQPSAPQAPPSTSSGAQAPPTGRPVQISTGPGPSVPSPNAQGPVAASPFAQGQGGAPAGAPGSGGPMPPLQPQGAPTGPYATPEETDFIQRAMSHPRGSIIWQQGLAKAQEIQQRRMTPLEAPKDMLWDNQRGAYVPKAGTQYTTTSQGPGGYIQQDAFGHGNAVSNPNVGPIPPAMMATNGPNGPQLNPIQGGQTRPMTAVERQQFGIPPTDQSVYGIGTDGKPVKIADAPFTPKDLGDRLTKLQASDQYKLADNATNMYTAAIQAAQRPGGISDVELRDFAARQFSGGVARQFNVEALNKAQGVWANIKQFAPEIISGQHMTPGARQALLQAMHDDAVQAQTAFGHLAQSDDSYVNSASGGSMSLRPFLPPLTRDLPPVPGVASIPNGMPGPTTPSPSQADAAAAELQRRGYHLINGRWTK